MHSNELELRPTTSAVPVLRPKGSTTLRTSINKHRPAIAELSILIDQKSADRAIDEAIAIEYLPAIGANSVILGDLCPADRAAEVNPLFLEYGSTFASS